MTITEQVRALIGSPNWKSMSDQAKYIALQAIDPVADVYTLAYASAKGRGTNYTMEDYPSLDEAIERGMAIYSGAKPLYAGSYVTVNDLGGESYLDLYVR